MCFSHNVFEPVLFYNTLVFEVKVRYVKKSLIFITALVYFIGKQKLVAI